MTDAGNSTASIAESVTVVIELQLEVPRDELPITQHISDAVHDILTVNTRGVRRQSPLTGYDVLAIAVRANNANVVPFPRARSQPCA